VNNPEDLSPASDLEPGRIAYALPLHKPIATWVLLGLILATFLLETLKMWFSGSGQTEVLVQLGANVTLLVAGGQYWRLFTSMFLHVGILHLLFNGYALAVIGADLERLLGWGRFLVLYLLSGLFGSLASYAFNRGISAGASGAIFGLIGGLAAFFALHRQQLGTWGKQRLANIAFLIVLNLFLGFTLPGIDNMAHLGGLLSGFSLGWALAPRYRIDPLSQRLVDGNSLRRYWPALLVAVLLLLSGIALVTFVYNEYVGLDQLHGLIP
jgi:rhomboid protease GluP